MKSQDHGIKQEENYKRQDFRGNMPEKSMRTCCHFTSYELINLALVQQTIIIYYAMIGDAILLPTRTSGPTDDKMTYMWIVICKCR